MAARGAEPRSTAGATAFAASDREIVASREVDAPRALVWDAWTRPEHVARWWGPRGFTLSRCEIDLRPGGRFVFVMRGPDGNDYPFDGTYREVVPPSRLVFAGSIDPEGTDVVVATVTFDERDAKTIVTVRQTVPRSKDAARGQVQGWTETLERLGEALAQR